MNISVLDVDLSFKMTGWTQVDTAGVNAATAPFHDPP